jgi:hypothetical protein
MANAMRIVEEAFWQAAEKPSESVILRSPDLIGTLEFLHFLSLPAS